MENIDHLRKLNDYHAELRKGKKKDPQVEDAIKRTRLSLLHWYVLYVHPQHEKKIRDAINNQGQILLKNKVLNYQIKAWVATRMKKHKRTDRIVEVEEVMTPGIVFVNLKQVDKHQIYIDKHITSFLFDRVSRQASIVPDDVMETFMTEYPNNETFDISMSQPVVGTKVKILRGVMDGKVGYLVKENGSHRFLIHIAGISFSFEVKESDIIVVDEKEVSESVECYSGTHCSKTSNKKSVKMISMEQFEAQACKELNIKSHRMTNKNNKKRTNP